MPAIFTEIQKEKLRLKLLETGLGLIKKNGYKKMTVSMLTQSCGIAKGTFYNFYKSKEDFTYHLMLYERNSEREKLKEFLSEGQIMTKDGFRQYLKYLCANNNNIFSYMSNEEITLLTTAWPDEYLLNMDNDESTSTWLLSLIPDKRPDCDWRIFANLMKMTAIALVYQNLLIQSALSDTIDESIEHIVSYIWGN